MRKTRYVVLYTQTKRFVKLKEQNHFLLVQCVYSKLGHLENTNQSHCRTKVEKINKRRISQSALGQKQFEQMWNGKNMYEK